MTPGAGGTIFALSSGMPPAAIGVIRVSGPAAGAALAALAGNLPPPRRAALRRLRDGVGATLDRALVLWFPGPRTATGEDVAELHIHGGRAVAEAVQRALAAEGLRRAEPGEFTRRAFLNGTIDLAEAEGLADLLAAETETQRRASLEIAGGALSRRVEAWRARVVDLAALAEAGIEYGEEDGVAVDEAALAADMRALAGEIAALLAAPPAERLRDGVRVVIAGPPNAGKSTLLNALAGRDAAITAPEAGTTRDVIEAPVVLDGIAYVLTDTAGLRDAEGAVERQGIARAEAMIAGADILLWLGEPDDAPRGDAVRVAARIDRPERRIAADVDVGVSALTGEGMDLLRALLARRTARLLPREGEYAVNRRQREALAEAREALAGGGDDIVLLAHELALARSALDRVTGRAGVEDMLDALFGRFCIGK